MYYKAAFAAIPLRDIEKDAKGKAVNDDVKQLQDNVVAFFKDLIEEGRKFVEREYHQPAAGDDDSIDDDGADDDEVDNQQWVDSQRRDQEQSSSSYGSQRRSGSHALRRTCNRFFQTTQFAGIAAKTRVVDTRSLRFSTSVPLPDGDM